MPNALHHLNNIEFSSPSGNVLLIEIMEISAEYFFCEPRLLFYIMITWNVCAIIVPVSKWGLH